MTAEFEAFRGARERDVVGPLGDAALVGTFWISGRTELDAFPGTWEPDSDNDVSLRYTPAEDNPVTRAGQPVSGAVALKPVTVASGDVLLLEGQRLRATAIHWPGIGRAVRLWDQADPAVADLAGIEAFPYDSRWRIEGVFTPLDLTIDYRYRGHGGRHEGRHVVGDVALTIAGRHYTLLATRGATGLTTVFGDATNGKVTYGGGRFAPIVLAEGSRAVVDFNFATLPPCAFSPHFDCPLPPEQNVIRHAVEAGEKQIVRR
ncbi:hypothetical protein SAMN05216548_103119 [Faunimonas pinastri]|uniref:DUF1684 domain-containing protein n=1 Tax=Faunimonas pinastri TaxID=1855383 RepID=A0A1H9EAD5_9HYPH|nr:DUF1684 domain-containing protein [Faunimonas pinastri]SEQ22696.1 hypothetical protein SAMN05216548_103119 [Faunimonas pinastri]